MIAFYDRAELSRPTLTRDGFLKAPRSKLARIGVLQYPGGNYLRSPEAMFAPEVLVSFELAPVVKGHPEGDVVTSSNARTLQIGSVGNLAREGDYLVGTVMITDGDAVADIRAGRAVQLSLGFFADLVDAPPGAQFNGAPYSKVQVNLRGQHVALVPQGRAGPEVRVNTAGVWADAARLWSLAAHLESVSNPLGITPKPAPAADSIAIRPGHVSIGDMAQHLAEAARGLK